MIIRFVLVTILLSALALLQSTVLSLMIPLELVPDLALLFLLFFGWFYGSHTGQICGFFLGLVMDALGLSPLGFHALLYAVIGYLIGLLRNLIPLNSIVFPLIAALLATVFKHLGGFLLSAIFKLSMSDTQIFNRKMAMELLLNLVLVLPVFRLNTLVFRQRRKGGFQ